MRQQFLIPQTPLCFRICVMVCMTEFPLVMSARANMRNVQITMPTVYVREHMHIHAICTELNVLLPCPTSTSDFEYFSGT